MHTELDVPVIHLSLFYPTSPCRLVVGEAYEGGLTPHFGRGICLLWGNFTAHAHICVVLI